MLSNRSAARDGGREGERERGREGGSAKWQISRPY